MPNTQHVPSVDGRARDLSARKARTWMVVLFVWIGFAVRTIGLTRASLWRDEVDTVIFALRPLSQTLSMILAAAQNGALYLLGMRPWLHLFGTSEFSVRYPAVLCASLSIPLLWQLSRLLVAERRQRLSLGRRPSTAALRWDIPLLTAGFFAINPYLVWYGREGRMYAPVTFLALASIWCWLRATRHGRWWHWAGWCLFITLAIYTHLLAVLLIPLAVLWFLADWRIGLPRWHGFVASLAALTLPYAPLVWWQWEFITAAERMTQIPPRAFDDIVRSQLLDHLQGVVHGASIWFTAPLIALLVVGVVASLEADSNTNGRGRKLDRHHFTLLLWFAAPTGLIALLSWRQPVFLPRYLIWTVPSTMMLLAAGIVYLGKQPGAVGRVLVGAAAAYIVLFWGIMNLNQQRLPLKADLRGAVQAIAAERRPEEPIVFQIPHLEHAYRYYSGSPTAASLERSDARLGVWAPGPITNPIPTTDDALLLVEETLAPVVEGATQVWLMYSEVETVDARRLALAWLDAELKRVETLTFHGVTVYRFAVRGETGTR